MDGQQDNQSNLLARLDERTKAIQDSLNTIRDDFKTQSEITLKKIDDIEIKLENKIQSVKVEMADRIEVHEKTFVTQEQFKPVQKIVYGIVGLILFSFGTALVTLVFSKHTPT